MRNRPEDAPDGVAAVDALCRRACSFAFCRLPSADGGIAFYMQQDGGESPMGAGGGFLLSPFAGTPRLIRAECTALPPAEGFPPMPEAAPEPCTSREAYHRLFETYHASLRQGLDKVVLARTQDIPCRKGFSAMRAFLDACQRYPSAFNALIHTPDEGTWLCSTPELLLRGDGCEWHTMALAGTRPAAEGALSWDAKNTQEHRLVADYIWQALESQGCRVAGSPPETLAAGAVEHLCTRFRFQMPPERLESLLRTLPPTPAVSGYPVDKAREFILSHPDIPRRLYAGYLGVLKAPSADVYVMLRCMRVFDGFCRCYAGGGIMPDSDEASEWRETEGKMQAMRSLIGA